MASIFTRIVNGEIPSYKVAENERFYAFLDINPVVKGHTLVIPKREVDYFFDLEDSEIADMMVFAKRIAVKLKASIKCKRVAVMILGMEVSHAHIHLLPINSESDVNFKNKLSFTKEEFEHILTSISMV